MEDDNGNIWIGTDNGGICCYVRRTKSFKRFPELYWKKEMFKIQSVTAIKQDSNGNIWFANSFFQYFIIDQNTLEIQPLKYEINEPIPEYYRISSMLEDKNKTMWLGTHYGLYYALVNNKSNKNNLFTERVFKKIPQITINDLFPNPQTSDSIYIVSNEGKIISFNVNNGGFKYEYTDIANEFTKNNETIQSTIIDKHGNWWFASMRGGLYQYEKSRQRLHNFQNQVFNLNSLSFNYLNHIYEDKQGLIWICTDGGGINFINPYAGNFDVYKYNPLDKNSISDNDIWSIYADKNYWIAGGSKGLSFYNKKDGKFTICEINKSSNKEASLSFYSAIKKAPDGDIYIATEGAGVFIFDPVRKKFTPIKIQNIKDIGTSCMSISSIAFDTYGNAWFGSFNEGLIKYNIEKKTAKVYLHKAGINSIAQNAVTSLLVDPYNHLWISLKDNGMDRMDIMSEKFIHFSATEKDAIRISSDEMLGLYLDSKNVLWAGSDRGINAINIQTNKVYTYNKLPGSSIDIVYAIVEDSIGRYWFSSNKGIFSFESPSPNILFGNKTQTDLLIESTLKKLQ
jgi:ligand-binding sensor domain-containing protein